MVQHEVSFFQGGGAGSPLLSTILIDGDPGQEFCGGAIGTDNLRFCTRSLQSGGRCDVKSHSKKVKGLMTGGLFVCAPDKGMVTDAAYIEPFLAAERAGDKLSELTNEAMTLEGWQEIFSAFKPNVSFSA